MRIPFVLCAFFATALGQQWTRIPGNVVHFSARGDQLWATTRVNSVLRWAGDKWDHANAGAQFVAAAADGRAWVLRTDLFANNVFRYLPASNSFENVPGTLAQISAATGDSAVGVNFLGDIYQFKNNTWKQLPGKALQVAIGEDNEIFMMDAKTDIYQLVDGGWQANMIGAEGKSLDVYGKNRAVLTDLSHNVFLFNGGTWQYFEGMQCARVSITQNRVYCQDAAGGLFYAVTEAPVTEAPTTEGPITEAPPTQEPPTEEPPTEEPHTPELPQPTSEAPAPE